MITDIIDIELLLLTVLLTREDTADIGLTYSTGSEARGIGKQSLKELDGNDEMAFMLNGSSREHSDILKALHVRKVALAECHEESDPLDLGEVPSQSLDLLVVEKIHILLSYLGEIILSLDLHRLSLYPLTVLHIRTVSGYFTEIDLGIKVRSERITVVSSVTVEDIDSIDLIEIMLLCICYEYGCDTGIETCSEKSRKTCLPKLLFICPLP